MSGPVVPRRSELDEAYATCRRIAAEHGRTYYLATALLSPRRRRAVHALYAFARMVDDIVDHADDPGRVLDPVDRTAALPPSFAPTSGAETPMAGDAARYSTARAAFGPAGDHSTSPAQHLDLVEKQLRLAIEQGDVDTTDPRRRQIIAATAETIAHYHIAHAHIWTFLDAMRMDVPGTTVHRTHYASMAELRGYMRGSAAAIGLQLLPVLGTVVPIEEAEPAAAALGEAFQVTNFLRDVAEDLDRGRVYLPADELAAFDVDEARLRACRAAGRTDQPTRRALAHLIAVNRDIYRRALPGIDLLAPRVRPAIRTAAVLYAEILDRIEAADFQIFATRATVPNHRRILVAAKGFAVPRR
ncbi:phytoene/squalene synthase family protein [Nocardia caishijiensis]|uniref:Phytoene synthase n=1 Tax=Nocardia caishijiensis TaxID=184756 RepID=A0ABQ6YG21_9NOCA|nr:phytoene/squalene synthase family protein [Nocardia caishijiensis]KAF0842480.1 phytoene synthase [Nocardia caishijiensis]